MKIIKPIDTSYAFETPEGVSLALNVAGIVPRGLAWAVDFLIQAIIYTILAIALLGFGEFGQGIFFICVFLVWWFYPVFFEIRSGSTPGKNMYELTVIHDNGTPITWQASITRNLLRSADFLPFLFGFGILCLLTTKNFKRLGDIAAGTLVVYRQKNEDPSYLHNVAPITPPQSIDMPAQRAILSFAERGSNFSFERKQELAGYIIPFIQLDKRHDSVNLEQSLKNNDIPEANNLNKTPVDIVLGYASWIRSGGCTDYKKTQSTTQNRFTTHTKKDSTTGGDSSYTTDANPVQFAIDPNRLNKQIQSNQIDGEHTYFNKTNLKNNSVKLESAIASDKVTGTKS